MKKFTFLSGVLATPVIFSLLFLVATVRAEPYGWSPDVDNSGGGPPSCSDTKPDKAPILMQPNHPLLPRGKAGEVRLFWHKVPGANSYNVYYGLSPSNYIFSAINIGDIDNFTVGQLTARRYYFAVQARNGCAASDLSNEWAGTPVGLGGGVGTALTSVSNTFEPEPTVVEEEPEATVAPEVQGLTEEVPPVEEYQPPANPNPFVPTPTPKPLSFWQRLLRIFFR
ncbi:MAG: hypothetical protein UV73_C0012G0098 [Candidatus Gottesmanbacteria bacterium GW2011_GWA2_43_14]|uniref:Fibronectin type-III domain-containing protein n=1 Tax=Candidatus Gottesmanbacteria bacterium GW2011_GWA2_43_14 TaxID=1618443 RepID=A0A0G1DDV0_9BACT|nr:MAG: hypothetical protein UV73_C0012G0098 [Candidatus Gottesmanbacteria bacterium GW2011_GWA2_43_14]